MAVGILFLLAIGIALEVLMMVGLWKAASKAGIFGLWAIIPIVQLFTLARIAGKPTWWGLLCLVPFVNLVILIIFYIEISKNFGRSVGTTLGLVFLPFIFWPILGIGSAEYKAN
ncbi:MAG: signal peptidase I [Planctomycetes bacterium]|nr:signal peptidase I [Planctomycetota bacterium]